MKLALSVITNTASCKSKMKRKSKEIPQWPKEKGQRDIQRSTKPNTEN
jgi:hypothetical protein